jgi:hypothetical protein
MSLREIHELAQEIYNDPANQNPLQVSTIALACRLLPGLHEYARQWDARSSHERAAVERTKRKNAFPAWACRERPDDLFKDED